MNWKEILKPNMVKIIAVIAIFLILYFFLLFTIRIQYICEVGGEACLKETQQAKQKLVLQGTLLMGIPLSIITYLFIGFLQSRKIEKV